MSDAAKAAVAASCQLVGVFVVSAGRGCVSSCNDVILLLLAKCLPLTGRSGLFIAYSASCDAEYLISRCSNR